MVKPKAREKAEKNPKQNSFCTYCSEKQCSCSTYRASFYFVMAIVIASFALGYLTLTTTAWIAALLLALKGLMYLTKHF